MRKLNNKKIRQDIFHVRGLVHKSIHKRRLGLIPKLGLRTVGLDWRES